MPGSLLSLALPSGGSLPPSGFSFLRHALACLWMSDESYLYDFLFSMQFSRYRERRSLTASGSHPWQGLPSLPRIAVRAFFSFIFGGHLLSHAVSSIVPSAARVLTIVFGMGTGVSPGRIAAKNILVIFCCTSLMPYALAH